MVRRSVPPSSKCVAKLCRSTCGVMCFCARPALRAACLSASRAASFERGRPVFAELKRYGAGGRSCFQYARRMCHRMLNEANVVGIRQG